MRDVGQMGESCFQQWCAAVGLVANGSKVDKTGWDFLVEFRFPSSSKNGPSAVHEAAFECRVQVKSTDGKGRKLPIKVSNLKRLATAPVPAFIVFIEFDGLANPQRVFVTHVGKALASQVLKRAHELEQNGEGDRLHAHKMTVKYAAPQMLGEVGGEALESAFASHIGDSLADYVTEKIRHLKSAGYEDGIGELSISVEGEDNIEKLINASIGLDSEVPVTEVNVAHTRFGTRIVDSHAREGVSKFELAPTEPTSSGMLRVQTDDYGNAVSFPADLYISPLNNMAPEHLQRARLKGDFFDFILHIKTGEIKFSMSFLDREFDLWSLRKALTFGAMLVSGQKLSIDFVAHDRPVLPLRTHAKAIDFALAQELAAVEAAIDIAARFKIADQITTSFASLSYHASRIIEFAALFAAEPRAVRLDIPSLNFSPDFEQDMACIAIRTIKIGSHAIWVVFSIIGRPHPPVDELISLYATERNVERVLVKGPFDQTSSGDLKRAAQEAIAKHESNYVVMTAFDLEQL